MSKIDWKKKLSSRKFWALIAGLVASLLALFKVCDSVVAQVVSVIAAFGSVAIYILAEAYVDGQAVGKDRHESNVE